MAGGLFALLDDVATMAKMAAASVDDIAAAAGRASTKAIGVVVDDTAVTPRYVTGFSPARELPMIWNIAKGSLRNKLLIILPIALLLSEFAPWALTPLLMIGGTYLSYEGAEKLWEKFAHKDEDKPVPVAVERETSPESAEQREKTMTSSAIRTDFILSAEIMVIALNEVASEGLIARAMILLVVGIAITALVYGVVALIVKADDIGLHLRETRSGALASLGNALVTGTPKFLAALAVVGTVAMLWVGGHILLVGAAELGWHAPYDLVHHVEVWVHDATGPLGAVLGWLVETFFSAVAGLLVGAVVVAIMHVLPFGKKAGHRTGQTEETPTKGQAAGH